MEPDERFLRQQIKIIRRFLRFYKIPPAKQNDAIFYWIETKAKRNRERLKKMRYFTTKEFLCPCCQKSSMDLNFIQKLDNARHSSQTPYILNSAYRCSNHNRKVGSSEMSAHRKGLAVDIRANYSMERFLIIQGLLSVGFSRIGIHEEFIHVDDDPEKDQKVIWLYDS